MKKPISTNNTVAGIQIVLMDAKGFASISSDSSTSCKRTAQLVIDKDGKASHQLSGNRTVTVPWDNDDGYFASPTWKIHSHTGPASRTLFLAVLRCDGTKNIPLPKVSYRLTFENFGGACGTLPQPKFGTYDGECANQDLMAGERCRLHCPPGYEQAHSSWSLPQRRGFTECDGRGEEPFIRPTFCRPSKNLAMVQYFSDAGCNHLQGSDLIPLGEWLTDENNEWYRINCPAPTMFSYAGPPSTFGKSEFTSTPGQCTKLGMAVDTNATSSNSTSSDAAHNRAEQYVKIFCGPARSSEPTFHHDFESAGVLSSEDGYALLGEMFIGTSAPGMDQTSFFLSFPLARIWCPSSPLE